MSALMKALLTLELKGRPSRREVYSKTLPERGFEGADRPNRECSSDSPASTRRAVSAQVIALLVRGEQ